MEFTQALLRFFQNGGPFMYPIALVLVIGLAMVVERWIFLTHAKAANRRAYMQLLPMLQKRNYQGVLQLARDSKAAMGRIAAAGIGTMQYAKRDENIALAIEEGILEAVPRLEKRTSYLATLANIATLLGLLGTIMGLISAFTAVANADPSEKASMLSSSISVAMNTTAFGLISAIPLLLFYSMLQNKTNEIVDSLQMAGVKFLNLITMGRGAAEQKATKN
ncbi:MotA/TolQ/ExbB proton channel family protein [Microbulbifer thermotolerans]|uniref:Flagellar motor protein MotA n=1 Tax=Microbulbifer thermotolerans TaxID=252514 RepID=A0A143HPT3_MICTH|nr:MotA/TolQ/ExbB proton channel family protein [Microbulbifer thermotolerans]AMX03733.1 flagellar motor protein MotA [Microbulbifer thermotolerans]MCX2780671.1 MotA/TolQ/ExbB proton channel family protein [Microbulbifer thermotolerans]MCX2783603.1 MotA/TolQ/ExbB proton channel family protein [Microbulbifer thermotolerans]MCX2795814.1 MotA/TolQ/ExbB proton channel family protein [Microbulbifer thermotolerans]MCX2801978.1 MotA/TolQ/ExbB proton channel family protein [Microbulbifer thermotoleran